MKSESDENDRVGLVDLHLVTVAWTRGNHLFSSSGRVSITTWCMPDPAFTASVAPAEHSGVQKAAEIGLGH